MDFTQLQNELSKIDTEINLCYVSDYSNNFDDFYNNCQEYIQHQEIIYYYEAMRYLSENDNSLNDSLELAYNFGYQVDNLNSETLATLLYQDKLLNELSNISDEIEKLYNEYNNQ